MQQQPMNEKQIAQQFCEAYYGALMQNRENLLSFYLDNSIMSYNGDTFVGIKKIAHKIESFGFKKIVYQIDDLDVQPGSSQGSLIIFVTGSLNMDDENTFKFSQVFNILPNGQGGFYVHNDIFRTVL